MMKIKFGLSLILIFSLLFNTLQMAAQSQSDGNLPIIAPKFEAALSLTENPSETFRGLRQSGDKFFARILAKFANDEDALVALEAQSVYFFEHFQSAIKEQLAQIIDKAREYNRQKYEKLKKRSGVKRTAITPKVVLPNESVKTYFDKFVGTDRGGFQNRNSSGVHFVNASYSPNFAPDEPEVKVTETETSQTATASDTKTIDTGAANITRSATNERHVEFKDNTMISETTVGEKVEAASKTSRDKLTQTSKITMSASFEVCPNAAGVVRGTGKTKVFSQTTIIKGSQIAALTTEYITKFQITGYVNDAAEFTHFDMTGTTTEKLLGFDRAVRVGMLDDAGGVVDGTKSINYQINGNTPQRETRDVYGMSHRTSTEFGKIDGKMFGIETEDEAKRVGDAGANGINGFMLELENLMRSSESRWQNYECVAVECVAVECVAPKTALKPNESVEVDTVSLSKLDSSKINANMKGVGTQTVVPENQKGTPNANYTLTAPAKGKAEIVVTSTSKRGIEIPVIETKKPLVKTPPTKPKDCDAGWTGTVKAVRTKREDKIGNANGALIRSVETVNETFSTSVQLLGTRDTTGGIVNNFIGDAQDQYLKSEYRESNYAPGRMSCGNSIITTPQTQKHEIQTKGDAKKRILVAVSVIGSWGHIEFSPPQIEAEQIISQTYESNCPSYNAVNTMTEQSEYKETITASFEVEFTVDPSKPNVIQGSKKVVESDGSETTYTWDLIRCN